MFNIKNYLEKLNCPCCKSNDFDIIKESNYKNIRSLEDLERIYKSSADEKLIDRLVKCNNCKFEYLNPRINSNIINLSYDNNIDDVHVSQNNSRIKTFKKSLKKITKILNLKNIENINILDIGSASGAFLKASKDFGFKETGYEPSKWMVDYGKAKYSVNLEQGRIQDIKSQKKFNMITFWDVIEHVTDLDITLNKIDELSTKDTILIINVPDVDSIMCGLFKSKWPFYLNVHLYYFNKNSIKKIFNKINFKLIDSFPHFQFLEIGYLCNRASKYFKFFLFIEKLLKLLKLNKLSVPYNLGQTTFILKKNDL